MEWRPAGSVSLPLLIFPCTIKSRSSLLAPAHPGGTGKRAVKWLWWWWYGIGQAIIFSSCCFFLLSFFLFFLTYSQPSHIGCLPCFHTWCSLSANLECRSEMCRIRLTKYTGRKKIAKKSPSVHHRTNLSGCIFATKVCIDNRGKNSLSSNTFSTCPHNMATFSPLMAEISLLVWGTPANFNGFRILASLLHRCRSLQANQT